MESTMEMNNKMKEDALKQMKKAQAAVKELQRDADEAHASKGEAQQQAKDLEKKVIEIYLKRIIHSGRFNLIQCFLFLPSRRSRAWKRT